MGTWEGPDDQAAQRFLAEHGMTWSLDDDLLGIQVGNDSLLPPWPPRVDGNGRIVKTSVATPVPVTTCAVCDTPVKRHGEAGWRHEVALNARGGCVTPWPHL